MTPCAAKRGGPWNPLGRYNAEIFRPVLKDAPATESEGATHGAATYDAVQVHAGIEAMKAFRDDACNKWIESGRTIDAYYHWTVAICNCLARMQDALS